MPIKVSKMFENLWLLSGSFPTLGQATWKVYDFCSPGPKGVPAPPSVNVNTHTSVPEVTILLWYRALFISL